MSRLFCAIIAVLLGPSSAIADRPSTPAEFKRLLAESCPIQGPFFKRFGITYSHKETRGIKGTIMSGEIMKVPGDVPFVVALGRTGRDAFVLVSLPVPPDLSGDPSHSYLHVGPFLRLGDPVQQADLRKTRNGRKLVTIRFTRRQLMKSKALNRGTDLAVEVASRVFNAPSALREYLSAVLLFDDCLTHGFIQ